MARLIDADALIKTLNEEKIKFNADVNYFILNAPTIDAEPIRHGHYIGESDGYADGYPVYDIWSCSECGCYFEDWDDKPTYKYCPYCGAKMEGEEE